MELDDAEYRLKPMNCPGHILIYKNSPKSYRDLPQRYAELGNVYRYERSGTHARPAARARLYAGRCAHLLHAGARLRARSRRASTLPTTVLKTFGFTEFKVELSTWDPKDTRRATSARAEHWKLSGRLAREGARRPRDSVSRRFPARPRSTARRSTSSWSTCSGGYGSSRPCSSTSTCRERFELEYMGEDGEQHQPVMVHRALFGSVERFFGVLIEHYAGAFPLWLAPVQVGLVPISEQAPGVRRER